MKTSILDLFLVDGHDLKQTAKTHGGEYSGPCPWCGGKDRFLVWPEHKGGRYWCRQCEKKGDGIQYLRDFHNLSYSEACQKIGVQPANMHYSAFPQRQSKPVFTPRETTPPGKTWQDKAKAFLDVAVQNIWTDSSSSKDARSFLHGKGLNDEVIKVAKLGWNPKDMYLDRDTWGLPSEQNNDGNSKKLWLPASLVIPCFAGEKIIRLRIRRPAGEPRYVIVSGGDTRPMTWNLDKKIIVIVESELDGWLVWQEAGDLVGVVALGTAQAKPDVPTHKPLKNAEILLVALDTDDAGARAAWRFWPETYGSKVKRWPCIRGKDPSEAWRNGLDIRAWIMAGTGKIVNSTKSTSIANEHQVPEADLQLAACFGCGGRQYWMSVSAKKWICECCHPPATEEIVLERRQI